MKIFSYLTLISILLLVQSLLSDVADGHDKSVGRDKKCSSRYEKRRLCGCSCTEKCENRLKPEKCPKEKKLPGCYCIKGFFRNAKGNCVPEDQCANAQPEEDKILMADNFKIRKNDSRNNGNKRAVKRDVVEGHQSDDGGLYQGGLPDDILSDLDNPTTPRPTIPPFTLRQGGLNPDQLDDDSTDEPSTLEDGECGPNEKFTRCGNQCKESLDFVKKKIGCSEMCEIGCFCKRNYFRDGFSNCNQVPDRYLKDIIGGETKVLPVFQCPRENEKYNDCGDRCMELLVNLNNHTLCKPYQCIRGCYCEENYLRDEEGVCVHAIRPKTADDDEDEDDDDDNKNKETGSKDGKGDLDEKGDKEGRNVRPNEISNSRPDRRQGGRPDERRHRKDFPRNSRPLAIEYPPDEVFSECGNRCMESLQTIEDQSVCDPNWCDQGFFCAPGRFRNRRGICVPRSQQRPFRQHQRYPPPSPRPPPPPPPPPPPKRPTKRSEIKCPTDETYSDCGNRCMESIANHMYPGKCDPLQCDTGCFCKPPLFRNKNGICFLPECFKSGQNIANPNCPRNEEYVKCGSRCLENIANIDKPSACAPNKCDVGCFCVNGYFRNRFGICVNPYEEQSPQKPLSCPPNEGFSECGNRCMESLENKLSGRSNCNPDQCNVGCFCLPELLRDHNGQCVEIPTSFSPDKSPQPSCKRDEEYLECGNDCGQTCADSLSGIEPICTRNCWSGCFCRRGYFKHEELGCVLPNKCQNQSNVIATESEPDDKNDKQTQIKCKRNEHFSECGSMCGQSCRLITNNNDTEESCPPECKSGCFCDQGLLRNDEGICVPMDQCICKLQPKVCEDPNEEHFWCYNECGRTCFDFKMRPDFECNSKCSRGCFCKDGFVRNENGVCVTQEECDLTKLKIHCNKNENYNECGSDCGRHCNDFNRTDDDFQCFSCESGCFCQKGFYRSDQGSCITKNECSVLSKIRKTDCGQSEEYTDCGNFCIEDCENVRGLSQVEVENCPFICQKGCICKEGFKRNVNRICVPENKCNELQPHCGQNEEYSECGAKCGQRCTDLAKLNLQCPLACEVGCFCKPGYFRDQMGVCIEKKECQVDPIECSDNEQYKKCGTRCGESCEDLKYPVDCPKECEEGCFCQNGLFRDIEGVCVNKTECGLEPTQNSIPDCPSNEMYKECGNKCDESCEDRTDCKSDCEKGCFCADGYLRHKTGKCVADDLCKALEQCVECETNEYYTDCGTDCGNLCSDIETNVKCKNSCRKGCFCKYGFHRNELGQCVTVDKCN